MDHKVVFLQVTTITNLVGGKSLEFQEFKALSKRFREGSLSCAEYYNKCIGVVGEGAFFAFLPELLALLPDIKKQNVSSSTPMRLEIGRPTTAEVLVNCIPPHLQFPANQTIGAGLHNGVFYFRTSSPFTHPDTLALSCKEFPRVEFVAKFCSSQIFPNIQSHTLSTQTFPASAPETNAARRKEPPQLKFTLI